MFKDNQLIFLNSIVLGCSFSSFSYLDENALLFLTDDAKFVRKIQNINFERLITKHNTELL